MHYNRVRTTGDPGPVERVNYPANLQCSAEGCDSKAKFRGVCEVHHRRARREVVVASQPSTRVHAWASPEDRLRRVGWTEVVRVKKLGPCWEWKGRRDRNGYGLVSVGKQKIRFAHRTAFAVWVNGGTEPPSDRYVCHRCDNPSCLRPKHLFLGDQFANMGDAKSKRRNANGARQGSAKLTDDQVIEIRAKYVPRKYTQYRLAGEYGVSQAQIGNIVRGRHWKTPTNARPE